MKKKLSVLIGGLSALVFAWAWGPVLAVGFLSDDYEWFVHVVDLPIAELWRIFWTKALGVVRFVRYRPLVGLLFWLDYRIWALQPLGYHLTNLFFHLVSVCLVFVLTKQLWELGEKQGKGGVLVGTMAASLFAVNPLLTEAVAWIDGRYDVVASAFLLGAIVAYLSFLKSKKRFWFVSAMVLAVFSLLSKEVGLITPLILGTITIYNSIVTNSKEHYELSVIVRVKEQLFNLWPFFLLWPVYLTLTQLALGKPFWVEQGYSAAINRPLLYWTVLTVLVFVFGRLKKKGKKINKHWVNWILLGLALLPIAFLPTQLRFLYLPSAFGSIWAAVLVLSIGNKLKRVKWFIVFWVLGVIISSLMLRRKNRVWLQVSLLQKRSIAEAREVIVDNRPELVYLFNFPDSIRGIPMFRSYVAEAVKLGIAPDESGVERVRIVVGPTPGDLSMSSIEVVEADLLKVYSDAGFVIFEPSVVKRLADGALEVDWQNEWTATISADRREVLVRLPRGLEEEGVLGLVFEEGEIQKIPLE